MRAVDIIRKKRDGHALAPEEIAAFVQGATTKNWPEYQVSALLMAIYFQGMNGEETAHFTQSMVDSGQKLDLSDIPGFKVDKHSTGGVGDKTSLILAPLAAACGCIVPKMSGRGLGHTGGTLDKLESIPGFRVDLNLSEFRQALLKVGCALTGQTREIVPADKVLYALRDVTATVESIPLISSSIMSKKLAEGIQGLVLDVKCGAGAFMKTPGSARELAESLVRIGEASGVKTVAFLTAMDVPLGHAVGNSLEVIECLETLKGRGPSDLEKIAETLAAQMVQLANPNLSRSLAEGKIRYALFSGQGLAKLEQIIIQQGGDASILEDYRKLPGASQQLLFRAEKAGFVSAIHAEMVGHAAMLLGAGREEIHDPIDHGAGILLKTKIGEHVKENEPLAELHFNTDKRLGDAIDLLRQAFQISDMAPSPEVKILDLVTSNNLGGQSTQ